MKPDLSLPLTRAGLLIPYVDYLRRLGAPVEKSLERHGLPIEAIEQPETLISTRNQMAFVGGLARSQGIDGLGWRVAQQATTGPLGAGLLGQILGAATLFEALKTTCAYARSESSGVELWLSEAGDSVFLCHRGTLAVGAPGQDEMSLWRTRTLISIVRLFVGQNWVPDECRLAMAQAPPTVVSKDLAGSRVSVVPDYSHLKISRGVLSRCLSDNKKQPIHPLNVASRSSQSDFVTSLQQVLTPYLDVGVPSVDDVAAMAGTSRRTFQRRLAAAGLTYKEVIRRVRFDRASRSLADPGNRIIDVAQEVGFDDPSHFSRFFRSMAGVSPRAFKRANMQIGT